MLVFALDTATLQGAYGWVKTGEPVPKADVDAYATLKAPAVPGHAETVLGRMQEVLSYGGYTLEDIDLLVYGRGPGTFTGIRIGLSTIKGIALACNTPVIGISSLEALALTAEQNGLVAALIDARRKELFAALYEVSIGNDGWPLATPILSEWVAPAVDAVERIAGEIGASTVTVTGNGVAPYRHIVQDALNAQVLPEGAWAPCPFWMSRIGHMRYTFKGGDDLASSEPVYLREPDARLPAKKLS
jgi:tRNA threonylcarbamoyladenosine biosynthesis protein TsaB